MILESSMNDPNRIQCHLTLITTSNVYRTCLSQTPHGAFTTSMLALSGVLHMAFPQAGPPNEIHLDFRQPYDEQYWQTSGPKFGPTRYPADRSIHWAGIGSGMPSPAPNRTQFGRTDMYAKCGSGRRFFRSIGSVFACRKPDKTSVEPLMKWDYPTRHFL